jgi:hypothetical protein
MKENYKDIPSWWFYLLLLVTIAVSLALCIFLKKEVQMPWWGLLFAAALAFTFTLPISIITATTNQVINLQALRNLYILITLVLVRKKKKKKPSSTNNTCVYTDARTKCDHGVHNGNNIARQTNSQCVLQDIWVYEHESGYLIS